MHAYSLIQQVVTQYYRAPELLLGAKHYDFSVDMWSVGCIYGELLNRKIMFLAANPLKQVDKICDILGTPTLEEVRSACDSARRYVTNGSRPFKPRNLPLLAQRGVNALIITGAESLDRLRDAGVGSRRGSA